MTDVCNISKIEKEQYENSEEEELCWALLNNLKPELEKQLPIHQEFLQEDVCCEKCESKNIVVFEGEHVCRECNIVQSRVIDDGAEWRFYGSEDNRSEDPTRCGMPTNHLLPKSSLGSMIGYQYRGKDNRDIRSIRRFLLWNSMPHWERTLYQNFELLQAAGNSQGISTKIIEDSKILFKNASQMKISRGDNKDGLVAACMYYACMINKVPRSTKEIAKMFKIDLNILTKGNSRFQELLKINVDCSGADDFIQRFGSNLNMNWEDIQKCKKLAKIIEELEIVSENAPTSVAAGTIYLYCNSSNIEYTKKHISEICGVSEVTITKCYKKLYKYKKELFEDMLK
jgi:transcription initiation factor TFIIIB Brf1 subunit/transcription initiation factor TFIIB